MKTRRHKKGHILAKMKVLEDFQFIKLKLELCVLLLFQE